MRVNVALAPGFVIVLLKRECIRKEVGGQNDLKGQMV
jgi:hypothetical protein